jgi:hypothetical protein
MEFRSYCLTTFGMPIELKIPGIRILETQTLCPLESAFVFCGFRSFFYQVRLGFRLPRKAEKWWSSKEPN